MFAVSLIPNGKTHQLTETARKYEFVIKKYTLEKGIQDDITFFSVRIYRVGKQFITVTTGYSYLVYAI